MKVHGRESSSEDSNEADSSSSMDSDSQVGKKRTFSRRGSKDGRNRKSKAQPSFFAPSAKRREQEQEDVEMKVKAEDQREGERLSQHENLVTQLKLEVTEPGRRVTLPEGKLSATEFMVQKHLKPVCTLDHARHLVCGGGGCFDKAETVYLGGPSPQPGAMRSVTSGLGVCTGGLVFGCFSCACCNAQAAWL